MSNIKVLFIALEFPYWTWARQWSYGAQLAFEEGFSENGVDCFTVTTIWLPRIKEICAGEHFDQVWMEVAHTKIDESLLEWIASLAPVRVGMIPESLEYNNEECDLNPDLRGRRALVEKRLRYLTHIVAVDENDVENINKNKPVPAMWWPSAVPKRCILEKISVNPKKQGAFIGSVYYQRAVLLKSPELQELLVRQPSSEDGTVFPYLFTALNLISIVFIKSRLPGAKFFLPVYLCNLRKLRKISFKLWLNALQSKMAVVNLPCLVKAYPSRVIEGMAAGRPVISWEIPNRPKNKNLFKNGVEILLYSSTDPLQLADHIKQVIAHPQMAENIVSNARSKLIQHHTIEKRVEQILEWIETGKVPTYS